MSNVLQYYKYFIQVDLEKETASSCKAIPATETIDEWTKEQVWNTWAPREQFIFSNHHFSSQYWEIFPFTRNHFERKSALTIDYTNKTHNISKMQGNNKMWNLVTPCSLHRWAGIMANMQDLNLPRPNKWKNIQGDYFWDRSHCKSREHLVGKTFGTTVMGKTNRLSRSLLQYLGATEEKMISKKWYLEKGHVHTYPVRAVIFPRSAEY